MRAALVIAFFVLVFPSVAVAHGGGSKHGYVSTVERIVNARGIEAEASGDGHFELTAPAGHTVIVRGYEGEPYLRFDEGEVYENERSPTTYVNRTTTARIGWRPSRPRPSTAIRTHATTSATALFLTFWARRRTATPA